MQRLIVLCLSLSAERGSGFIPPAFRGRTTPVAAAAATTTTTTTRMLAFDPLQIIDTASSLLADSSQYSDAVLSHGPAAAVLAAGLDGSTAPPEVGGISYSKASYYTVLGLYLLSFPGLWSTIKRSTAAKVKNKTFVTAGEASGGKGLREQAGEIMACTYERSA
jgi:Cofactor assembly of complex C subunit B